ncbi:hypothetical protein C0989_008887 [Termitomyces sp. Mn162]|nr:hypothetical protein C0989_008887 [Termitomyces sp. Mn162]
MDSANPSSSSIFVFDPENEHHRRVLRLRSVLPEFILAINRGLENLRRMQEALENDVNDSKSEAATPTD